MTEQIWVQPYQHSKPSWHNVVCEHHILQMEAPIVTRGILCHLLCTGVICVYGIIKNKLWNQKNRPNLGSSPYELWYRKSYYTQRKFSFLIWKIGIIKFMSQHYYEDQMVKYFKNLELNGLTNVIFPFNIWDFSGEGVWQSCVCVTGFVVCNWIQINLWKIPHRTPLSSKVKN